MQLDTLCPELLLQISEHLSHPQWKCLRLTCKTLADLFAPLVVDKITINADRDGALELVESISESSLLKPPLYAIKALMLLAISETVLPSENGNSNDNAQDSGRAERDSRFINALLSALSHLDHIQKIKWEICSLDNLEFVRRVGEVISAYQTLEDLHVVLVDTPSLPVLKRFQNLTSVSYTVLEMWGPTLPAMDIGHVLIQSPKLCSLSVYSESYGELLALLAPCASEGIVLSLTSLQLRKCPSLLPLLLHVRHLKVLDIMSGRYIAFHKAERQAALKTFWAELVKHQVTLTHITVDEVSEGLIKYLKSYTRLVYFSLRTYNKPNGEIVKRMQVAHMFYHEAMINHSPTLERLVFRSDYGEEWCWNSEIQTALTKCRLLKHICIGVSYSLLESSISREESQDANLSSGNSLLPLHLMIHSMVTQCPSVSILELHSTLADAVPFNDRPSIFGDMWNMLELAVSEYEPRTGVERLQVTYGRPDRQNRTMHFASIRDKEGNEFVYRTCK